MASRRQSGSSGTASGKNEMTRSSRLNRPSWIESPMAVDVKLLLREELANE